MGGNIVVDVVAAAIVVAFMLLIPPIIDDTRPLGGFSVYREATVRQTHRVSRQILYIIIRLGYDDFVKEGDNAIGVLNF